MGERGPLPKTRSEDSLAGNPGRRPPKKAIPVPDGGELICPDWLAEDGKDFWARIVPQLQAKSLIDITDYASLVNLCIAWSEVKRYHEYTSNGKAAFYKAPGGQIIPHPAVGQLRQAQTRLDSIMKQFGLSPASRARIPMIDLTNDSLDQEGYAEFRKG